jgi:hypothetical protein
MNSSDDTCPSLLDTLEFLKFPNEKNLAFTEEDSEDSASQLTDEIESLTLQISEFPKTTPLFKDKINSDTLPISASLSDTSDTVSASLSDTTDTDTISDLTNTNKDIASEKSNKYNISTILTSDIHVKSVKSKQKINTSVSKKKTKPKTKSSKIKQLSLPEDKTETETETETDTLSSL